MVIKIIDINMNGESDISILEKQYNARQSALNEFFKNDKKKLLKCKPERISDPVLTPDQARERLESLAEFLNVEIKRIDAFPDDLESNLEAHTRRDLSHDEDTGELVGFDPTDYYYRIDANERTVIIEARTSEYYHADLYINGKYVKTAPNSTLLEIVPLLGK